MKRPGLAAKGNITMAGSNGLSAAVKFSPDAVWNIGRYLHMGYLVETRDHALLVARPHAGFVNITKVRVKRFRATAKRITVADQVT